MKEGYEDGIPEETGKDERKQGDGARAEAVAEEGGIEQTVPSKLRE